MKQKSNDSQYQNDYGSPLNDNDFLLPTKKPIYKKFWFWLIIAFLLLMIIGSVNDNPKKSSKSVSSSKADKNATSSESNDSAISTESDNDEQTNQDDTTDEIKEENNEPEEDTTETKTKLTKSQINARKKAKDYLKFMSFSAKGLIQQLEFEGFSHEDAIFGAATCGADWNEQAVKKAEDYLNFMSFSAKGLIEQLEFDGFTHEQAVYGAQQNGL